MGDYFTSAFLRRLTSRKGKPWCGVLKYRDPADPSKFRQKTKTFDPKTIKTKSQANTALEAWRADEEAKHGTPDADLLVGSYVDRYIKTVLVGGGAIEGSTEASYHYSQLHIEKGFPTTTIRELDTKSIQSWVNGIVESGLSASTAGKAFRLLRQACSYAVSVRDLQFNPTDAVRPPKRAKLKSNILEGASLRKMICSLDAMERTPVVVAGYLAVYAGLRRGEICGLKWSDVDLDGSRLAIQRAIGRARGGTYVKGTKEDESEGIRYVAVDDDLITVLSQRRQAMATEWSTMLVELGLPVTTEAFQDLYVVGRIDGAYADPVALSKQWSSLASNIGLQGTQGRRMGLHDLRHTFVSLQTNAGIDPKTVAEQAGHSDTSVTMDIYAAATTESKRRAAAAVGDALRAARDMQTHQADILPFVKSA